VFIQSTFAIILCITNTRQLQNHSVWHIITISKSSQIYHEKKEDGFFLTHL